MTQRIAQPIQALREAIKSALSNLPYTVQNADGTYGSATLGAANVVTRAVWLTGPNPPDPLVAFSVGGKGAVSRVIPDRKLVLKTWTVSDNEYIANTLYEAVRNRIHTGDQDAEGFASDMSLAATNTTLGVVIRECIEIESLPADFDVSTGRWYAYAAFRVTAL